MKMGKPENEKKTAVNAEAVLTLKNKQKQMGRKRKRSSSDSSSNDDSILADNALEMERNVHASAIKNNLDETSVRKIIKKVVTNDHVLALVKLREEEEAAIVKEKKVHPKLTRAKVKELKKVSPKTAWNLENLELTPINHIPVKTRPEVKALIAQELPEDEDDDEYEPTHDDVLSEDDHASESFSDVDSQPRTPATPVHTRSPKPLTDGPFKVPQEVSSARRKLNVEEEATIALRTRSKLSLSSTSIEHIESTFVPPDDIPMPIVDDLWNDFLNECLNPASASKNEDDDETDPEYNVAADPDAQDEDEEALGNSIIKISKKELNDLVTELFNVMPAADEDLAENLANSVLTDNTQITQWKMKEEPLSDEETSVKPSERLTFEKRDYSRISIGKNEPDEDNNEVPRETDIQREKEIEPMPKILPTSTVQSNKVNNNKPKGGVPRPMLKLKPVNNTVEISIEERVDTGQSAGAPPSLRPKIAPATNTVHIEIKAQVIITPEQRLILQQQLRQHIQVATSNFLQLYVHPVFWKMAPAYKEYLESLTHIAEKNPASVVNVCNLKAAMELVNAWEQSVSEDTPENRKMIEFIQSEVERNRRRAANNCLYVGNFHPRLMEVVASSPVFLYPYLLPSMPYRPDAIRRFYYTPSEDVLIVLGLDQFSRYVEANPDMYPIKSNPRARRYLTAALQLLVKHMMPWATSKALAGRIHTAKHNKCEANPIYRYFKYNEIPVVQHKILPYNPNGTLYDLPEHEMPKIWLRYLAKTNRRFRNHLHKRTPFLGNLPEGVPIDPGISSPQPDKLPADFTKPIANNRQTLFEDSNDQNNAVTPKTLPVPATLYKLVETSAGAFLMPLEGNDTSKSIPIITTEPEKPETKVKSENTAKTIYEKHCACCVLLRRISRTKQTLITDYFKRKGQNDRCACSNVSYPKISKRLKLLVKNHKNVSELNFKELERRLSGDNKISKRDPDDEFDAKEMAYVLSYQLKVFSKASISRRIYVKKRVYNLLKTFKLDSGDPVRLAGDLSKTFDTELVDLYLDFLGFLTPEQADKLNLFKEYFTRNCAKELMDRIEEQVDDNEVRQKMLSQIKSIHTDSASSSCQMCTSLLNTMEGYPKLAEFVFSLFPHTKELRSRKIQFLTPNLEENEANDTKVEDAHNTVDYEADHSSCCEDSDTTAMDIEKPPDPVQMKTTTSTNAPEVYVVTSVKTEPTEFRLEVTETAVTKSERQDDDSDASMCIDIKTEPLDWRRDEDKIILEVVQDNLSPEVRRDKTIALIVEQLEDKNVYATISERLVDRSMLEIKERLLYLLSLLVMSDNCGNSDK